MDLIFPTRGGSVCEIPAPTVEVYIAGARRVDAVCTSITLGCGFNTGRADIWFPSVRGERPYARYDAVLALENDLVEIMVRPHGVLFRGYVVARRSEEKSLIYGVAGLEEKFNATFFGQEFNYLDEVTGARKYPWTVRQIAEFCWRQYAMWAAGLEDDAALLAIDLESFPETVPNETNVMGQPLLRGLATIMESVDYRLKLMVVHGGQASTIKAYVMGGGAKRLLVRGEDTTRNYTRQPGGVVNVVKITREADAGQALSHIAAEGDNRVVESAFMLTPDWNEVENDFEPPEGHSLKEYVTIFERETVINNWATYTTEKVDLKQADTTVSGTKGMNPNYRRKYERVARRFKIQTLDDIWYANDDPVSNPVPYGEMGRQVKLEGKCVQTFGGAEVGPFVVYKRVGDPTLYVMREGFTIHDSQWVEFNRPMVDTVSNLLAKGLAGAYVPGSWNAGDKTSQYKVTGAPDLTATISAEKLAAGVWLMLGEYHNAPYKVTARTTDTLTVQGNLTDAGADGGAGAQWMVTDYNPILQTAMDGVGATQGRYQIAADGDDTIINAYAGLLLIAGNIDATTGALLDAPADLKTFVIARDSEKYLYTDKPNEDLTGSPASYMILAPRRETKRLLEWVALNDSWKSLRRLGWASGDVGTTRNKRIVYKNNNEYKWISMAGNYLLKKVETAGEEDKYTVMLNPTPGDVRNDGAALALWASNQIQGANQYKVKYPGVVLQPMDFGLQIGMRPVDTRMDTGATVVGITYDLIAQAQTVEISSWG
jgi:hypothetical protein